MKVTPIMIEAGCRAAIKGHSGLGPLEVTTAKLSEIFTAMLQASAMHDVKACSMMNGRGLTCTCDAYDLSEADLVACMDRAFGPNAKGPERLPEIPRAFAQEVLTAYKARVELRFTDQLKAAHAERLG